MGNLVSPSFDILKTWQGIVEMILRVACVVLCFILMICAAVATNAINNIEDIDEDSDDVTYDNAGRYRSAAGWLIFVAIMGMIIEPIIIIIRILNVYVINQNFILFGFIDIAISVVFTLCLFAGAVANAAYASDNSDTYDNGCDVNDDDRSNDAQDACDNLATVRDAEGATAAFGFFAMVSFGLLAGIIVYVIITQHFNKSGSGDPSSHYTEEPEPRN